MTNNVEKPAPTAAILIIGNEILSGRVQDLNINYIAGQMTRLGVRLLEVRVVPDVERDIVEAVNALRNRFTYVFTTGGIGPTHDDITAVSMAKAFGVRLIEHAEARSRLEVYFTKEKLTPARLLMARVPEGSVLIDNPSTVAPGFRFENVYVMAGVPNIMQAMMGTILGELKHGPSILSRTVLCKLAESDLAEGLAALAQKNDAIDIGSYPSFRVNNIGLALVARGTDEPLLDEVAEAICALVREKGGEPILEK